MEAVSIENRAEEIPFAAILEALLRENLTQHAAKRAVFKKMRGTVAIELPDIEAAVTLVFEGGSLRIEAGTSPEALLVIRTESERVMDLNALRIVGDLPWYFDETGRKVLGHLLRGRLKIRGIASHPLLLTRLTVVMSVA